MNIKRISLLGLYTNAAYVNLALTKFMSWIEAQCSNYVYLAPTHSLMEYAHNPAFFSIFNGARMVSPCPDGIAVVWLTRFYGFNQIFTDARVMHAFQNRSKRKKNMTTLRIESENEFCDQIATLKSSLGMTNRSVSQ